MDMETSKLIQKVNQCTGFYLMSILAWNGLNCFKQFSMVEARFTQNVSNWRLCFLFLKCKGAL